MSTASNQQELLAAQVGTFSLIRATAIYDFAAGGEQNLLPAVPASTKRIVLSVVLRDGDTGVSAVDAGLTFGWDGSNLGSFDTDTVQDTGENFSVTVSLAEPNPATTATPLAIGVATQFLQAGYSGTAVPATTAKLDVVYYDVPV